MKKNIKALVVSLAIPLLTGGLAALISSGKMGLFQTVEKPPLAPPAWLFPVAWTILYALMGYAAFRVFTANAPQSTKKPALTFYAVQLAFNFFWTLIFFNLEAYTFAFIWLAALLILIVITAFKFYAVDRIAAYLLIPYIVWVTFAGYLNLGVALLN